jgi:hypothetical protein
MFEAFANANRVAGPALALYGSILSQADKTMPLAKQLLKVVRNDASAQLMPIVQSSLTEQEARSVLHDLLYLAVQRQSQLDQFTDVSALLALWNDASLHFSEPSRVVEAFWLCLGDLKTRSQLIALCLPIVTKRLASAAAVSLVRDLAHGHWPSNMAEALQHDADGALRVMVAAFSYVIDRADEMDGFSDDMTPTERLQLAVGTPSHPLSLLALMLCMQDNGQRWNLDLHIPIDHAESGLAQEDASATDSIVLVLNSVIKAKCGLVAFVKRLLTSISVDRTAISTNLQVLTEDQLTQGFLLKSVVLYGGLEGLSDIMTMQSHLPWLRHFAEIASTRGLQFFKRRLSGAAVDLFSLFTKGAKTYQNLAAAALDAAQTGQIDVLTSLWDSKMHGGMDRDSLRMVVGILLRLHQSGEQLKHVAKVNTFFQGSLLQSLTDKTSKWMSYFGYVYLTRLFRHSLAPMGA